MAILDVILVEYELDPTVVLRGVAVDAKRSNKVRDFLKISGNAIDKMRKKNMKDRVFFLGEEFGQSFWYFSTAMQNG